MFKTRARTPAEYIAGQPPDRRTSLSRVRQVIRKHLPSGYREVINWGMITYEVPLTRFPKTYNGQPLCYAGLAAQKRHLAVYLMSGYATSAQGKALRDGFKKAGKKLDMGQSCIRFQTADDLALGAIGKAVASMPVKKFIEIFEKARRKK